MQNRTKFLFALAATVVVASVLVFAFARTSANARRATPRPNILFLLADDWAWPHAGAYGLATDRRPAEELYDLRKDPGQINNIAGKSEYALAKKKLRAALDNWMRETGDPRATTDDDRWDRYRYFGSPDRGKYGDVLAIKAWSSGFSLLSFSSDLLAHNFRLKPIEVKFS